jgi:hypothetical protein
MIVAQPHGQGTEMATEPGPKGAPPVDPYAGRILTAAYRGRPVSLRYDGLATPAQGRRLTDAEYRSACFVADRIGELKASTEASDASVSVGANIWARHASWHPLFAKNRWHLDHLRLFCQPFTGFDMITNRPDGPVPPDIPPDIDDLLRRNMEVSEDMIGLVADRRRLPDHAWVRLPLVFGEAGPVCDGELSSPDVGTLQAQMYGLHGSGVLDRLRRKFQGSGRATVVEIGSEFGGLGYQLPRALGADMRYVAVDLPDSLLFAAIYLSRLWSDRPSYLALRDGYLSIRSGETVGALPDAFAGLFVASALADRVFGDLKPIDLVLNFRSMQEMSDAQVAHYGRLARETLAPDGFLYEQNGIGRSFDRDVKAILGSIFPFGGTLPETDPRPLSAAGLWSNQPIALTPPAA